MLTKIHFGNQTLEIVGNRVAKKPAPVNLPTALDSAVLPRGQPSMEIAQQAQSHF